MFWCLILCLSLLIVWCWNEFFDMCWLLCDWLRWWCLLKLWKVLFLILLFVNGDVNGVKMLIRFCLWWCKRCLISICWWWRWKVRFNVSCAAVVSILRRIRLWVLMCLVFGKLKDLCWKSNFWKSLWWFLEFWVLKCKCLFWCLCKRAIRRRDFSASKSFSRCCCCCVLLWWLLCDCGIFVKY